MHPKLSNLDWHAIERFFYESMLEGWARGEKPEVGRVLEGHRHFSRVVYPLKLTDMWSVTPGSRWSSGSTTIWYDLSWGEPGALAHEFVPIWVMQYGGCYKKEAIDFLRRTVRADYGRQLKFLEEEEAYRFNGCRGPGEDRDEGLIYKNSIACNEGFMCFAGREHVLTFARNMLGFHSYMGYALVSL